MPVELIETNPPTRYFLVGFDDNLAERAENGALLTEQIIGQLQADTNGQQALRHVFILSHGWRADVPAARRHYEGWIRLMVEHKPADIHGDSLIVGLHWPSEPFGQEEFEPHIMGAAADDVDQFAHYYAAKLSPDDQEELANAIREIVQPHQMQARQLGAAPGDVGAIARFERLIGLEPGSLDRFKQSVQRLWETQKQFAGYLETIESDLTKWYVRMASFWKMKQRAFEFGSTSAAEFLRAIIANANPNVRTHLVGHSFGSIVVSAMADALGEGQVHSLSLIQGAVEFSCFCSELPLNRQASGPFHEVIAESRVRGPIIVTHSKYDSAVGVSFPIAETMANSSIALGQVYPVNGGLGFYGARGFGAPTIDVRLRDNETRYKLFPGLVHNFESSDFICDGGFPSGAHSDILKPELANAIWQAVGLDV